MNLIELERALRQLRLGGMANVPTGQEHSRTSSKHAKSRNESGNCIEGFHHHLLGDQRPAALLDRAEHPDLHRDPRHADL